MYLCEQDNDPPVLNARRNSNVGGACSGCGETPYVKLLTQMFGDRFLKGNNMVVDEQWKKSLVIWVVVSDIFYFHPYLGKIPILTNIFQRGWNHQLVICVIKTP